MDTVTAHYERVKEAQQRAAMLDGAQGAWMQILLLRRSVRPLSISPPLEQGPEMNNGHASMPSPGASFLRALAYRRAVAAMRPSSAAAQVQHYAHSAPFSIVQGEILRDRQGRLYERTGSELRPLPDASHRHATASSRSGHDRPASETAMEDDRGPAEEQSTEEYNAGDSSKGAPRETAMGDTRPSPAGGYQKAFPDPGRRCLARFGDVKHFLGSQVAQPSRLRDEHQLPCYVQVYEITAPHGIESLTSTLLSETGYAGKLYPLTDLVIRALRLHDAVRRRPMPQDARHRAPGVLLPGDRVFRLQVIQDPTKEREPAEAVPAMQETSTGGDHSTGVDPARSHSAHLRIPKTHIPSRYLKSWEFQLSREEALYDMREMSRLSFAGLYRGFKRWMHGQGAVRKWQALLAGKALDEQLWAVKPPKGSLQSAAVRAWATSALASAGYDPRTMLEEWEIYWRRKGL